MAVANGSNRLQILRYEQCSKRLSGHTKRKKNQHGSPPVFVNPSNDKVNGHCSKKEVATMALRAKNMGMRIMIDFHYSDSWADPGKQNKPAAWVNYNFSQLMSDLYNHTFEVLDTLKSIGAKPDWVQIGYEISGGMLWPDGSTSNW
jgi:arabinogalactan endo-1,4-beta-galactosidase